MHTGNLPSSTCHVIKASKIAKVCFSTLQGKVLSYCEEEEAPVEFISKVEEH